MVCHDSSLLASSLSFHFARAFEVASGGMDGVVNFWNAENAAFINEVHYPQPITCIKAFQDSMGGEL